MTAPYVEDKYNTDPLPALAAGKTGWPETLSRGGAKAVGKIVFTDNPTAAEAITIGGVTITFVASGATGNQVNIGATLSDTITALIAMLDAHGTLGSLATYTKTDTNTALTVTSDGYDDADNGADGNLGLAVSAGAVGTVTQMTGGMDISAISLQTENTVIAHPSGTERFTLADGDEFQNKTILNNGGGVAHIAGTFTGGTVMTLDNDEYCALRFLNGEWKVKESTGAIT